MDLILKLKKGEGKIKERVHKGECNPDNRLAEITVDVFNPENNMSGKNLKALIDTGATNTLISIKTAKDLGVDLDKCEDQFQQSAHGIAKVKKVFNIWIRILPLMDDPKDYIQLVVVNACNFGNYEVSIGNDVLSQCEFIYNGLSKTYFLKLIRIE